MVARPSRYARVWNAALGRDCGDDRLRTVAAGHRERVGPVRDRVPHELPEIVSPLQLDRLDAARAGLVGEVEAFGPAPARLRIHEQDGVPRRRRAQLRAATTTASTSVAGPTTSAVRAASWRLVVPLIDTTLRRCRARHIIRSG